MPSFSKNKTQFDKEHVTEIIQKCSFLGISLTEKEFLKNPQHFSHIVDVYDSRINQYISQNNSQLLKLQTQFSLDGSLTPVEALVKARQTLITEAQQIMIAEFAAFLSVDKNNKNESFAFDNPQLMAAAQAVAQNAPSPTSAENIVEQIKSQPLFLSSFRKFTEEYNSQNTPSLEKSSTAQTSSVNNIDSLVLEFEKYKDSTSGKPLLDIDAKNLKKKDNLVYLNKILNAYNLKGDEANSFRASLSRHHGNLRDFLLKYQALQTQQADFSHNSVFEISDNKTTETIQYSLTQQKQQVEELKRQQALEKQQAKELKRQQALEKQARLALQKQQAKELKRQQALEKQARLALQKQQAKELKRQQALEKQARLALQKKLQAQKKIQKSRHRKALKLSLLRRLKNWSIAQRKALTTSITSIAKLPKNFAHKFITSRKKPKLQIVKPAQKNIFSRLLDKMLYSRKNAVIKKISLNIQNYKNALSQQKKAKIVQFKQSVRSKTKKTLKYAAITLPIAGLSYTGFNAMKNASPAFKFDHISLTFDNFHISPDVMTKASNMYTSFTENFDNLHISPGVVTKASNMYASLTETLDNSTPNIDKFSTSLAWIQQDKNVESDIPINEADYDIQAPLIKNDILHNVPNTDFFNLCFDKVNVDGNNHTKYGIPRKLYNDFMRENKAMANFFGIGNYSSLSFDDARIIAKTQIYDKYGIGYMQNKSIAAYLYYTLVKNHEQNSSVASLASSVIDFCSVNGVDLSDKQISSLNDMAAGKNFSASDWHALVAAVNSCAINQTLEKQLFTSIQQSQFLADVPFNGGSHSEEFAKQAQINADFAYQPTFDFEQISSNTRDEALFADAPILPELSEQFLDENFEKQLLNKQKEKEIETFSRVYAQCCYNNVIRLSYGDKRKAFDDANKTLARHGIRGKIDRRLYCAGMSAASFCQAYDIFVQENPNSFVAEAVKDIIGKYKNCAHSSVGMRNTFKKHSKHLVNSKNLEKDIKNYMNKHNYAILQGGFQRNSAGNQHYNGFFPTMNLASKDAYTYCAYNNNHWGNEKTFSSVLRDRRRARFGKSGWYVDVSAWIDDLAQAKINQELKVRKTYRQDTFEEKSLIDNTQKYLDSLTNILYQRIVGR